MRRPYAHVAFDLDGTLIDSRVDLAAAVNEALRGLGRAPLPAETIGTFVGDGVRPLLERALGGMDRPKVLDAAMAAFLEHYRLHLLDETVLYPGILDLLDALRYRGVTISILSNKPEALVSRILDGLGITSWFLAVLGGDSLATRKPHPGGVQRLLALAGVAPSQALLVGDSPIDLDAAAAAGVGFCGVEWGFAPERLRAAAPPVLISRAAEVLEVVERGYAPARVPS